MSASDDLDDLLSSLISDAQKPAQRQSVVQQRAPAQQAQPQRVSQPQQAQIPRSTQVNAQPQRAVVSPGPVQPQRAVVSPGPVQPQRAVVSPGPVQPQRAVVSPGHVQPQRAVVSPGPVQPQRAVVNPGSSGYAQPQKASYSGGGGEMAELDMLMESLQGPAQPQKAVVSPAQPQRAVVSPAQPQRAVVNPGSSQPQRAVISPAQPQRAVVSGGPNKAVQTNLVPQAARSKEVEKAALEDLLGKVQANLDAVNLDSDVSWDDGSVERPESDLEFNVQAIPVCWVGDDYIIKLIVSEAEYLGGKPYRFKNMKSIDCIITDQSTGALIRINPVDNSDGTYSLSFVPESVGDYHALIKILGRPHFDFNFRADDAPNPMMCTATASQGKAKQPLQVTITARNKLGNNTNAHCPWEVNVSTPPNATYTDTSLSNNGNGVYVITFTPTGPGVYSLYLSLKGQPIKTYPLSIPVSP
eukprot:TRINITY_DN26_c0_g1_i1.p1 TRINITY_DN26_c0_g1~~TRINITY_DN26_c0_g1_i1.p1  ORF type:complete len:469 (-),score=134.94 TRINITY_DN26_c0_g1_i1:114-1520(-)